LNTKTLWPAVLFSPALSLDKIKNLVANCLLKINSEEIHVLPIKRVFNFYSCFDLQAALKKRYWIIISNQEYDGDLCRICLNKFEKIMGCCNTYNFGLDYCAQYDLKELILFLKEQNYKELAPVECFKSPYLKQLGYQDVNNVYHPNMLSIRGIN